LEDKIEEESEGRREERKIEDKCRKCGNEGAKYRNMGRKNERVKAI
jgi:hypothetical protein